MSDLLHLVAIYVFDKSVECDDAFGLLVLFTLLYSENLLVRYLCTVTVVHYSF